MLPTFEVVGEIAILEGISLRCTRCKGVFVVRKDFVAENAGKAKPCPYCFPTSWLPEIS